VFYYNLYLLNETKRVKLSRRERERQKVKAGERGERGEREAEIEGDRG
jgi:hypothetical protein